jgi:hypothetical protein
MKIQGWKIASSTPFASNSHISPPRIYEVPKLFGRFGERLLIAINAMLHVTIKSITSSQNITFPTCPATIVLGHRGEIGLNIHAIANSF